MHNMMIKTTLKKLTLIISTIFIGVASYSSLSLGSPTNTSAIKLQFSSQAQLNPIFIYKAVQNPVAQDRSAICPTTNPKDHCYVWKQVGYLGANNDAYVFIDPAGTKDKYGQDVRYKLAQAITTKSNDNETVKGWIGLCTVTPTKLQISGVTKCGDNNNFLRYSPSSNGKNYAEGYITVSKLSTDLLPPKLSSSGDVYSIGMDNTQTLPVFYSIPSNQKSIPISFLVVGPNNVEPAGFYLKTNSVCGNYNAVYKPTKNPDDLYYASTALNSITASTTSLYQNAYDVPSIAPKDGCKQDTNGGQFIAKFSTNPATNESTITLGKNYSGGNTWSYYGTYSRFVYPTKPVYCTDQAGNVHLFGAGSAKKSPGVCTNTSEYSLVTPFKGYLGYYFPKTSGVIPSDSTYKCPLSTGYTVQLSSFCPSNKNPSYKKISNLHPFNSKGKIYLGWENSTLLKGSIKIGSSSNIHTNKTSPYVYQNFSLATAQKKPSTIELSLYDDKGESTFFPILATTFTAGAIGQIPNKGPEPTVKTTTVIYPITWPGLLWGPDTTFKGIVCQDKDTDCHLNPTISQTTYTFDNLKPNTPFSYTFKLQTNLPGASSDTIKHEWKNKTSTSKYALNAPTNIKYSVDNSNNSVTLSWPSTTITPSGSNEEKNIFYTLTSTPSLKALTKPSCNNGNCSAKLQINAQKSQTVMVTVAANLPKSVDSVTPLSALSSPIAVKTTPPPATYTAPSNIQFTLGKIGWQGKLSWKKASSSNASIKVKNYSITINPSAGGIPKTTAATDIENVIVTRGTTYTIKITALFDDGHSKANQQCKFQTPQFGRGAQTFDCK